MNALVNTLVCGDCIEVLGKIRKPFAELVFADRHLPGWVANQLRVRMDSRTRRDYPPAQVLAGSEELA